MANKKPNKNILVRLKKQAGKNKGKIIALFLLLSGGLLGYNYFFARDKVEETFVVQETKITESFTASGQVSAKKSAELKFAFPSKVVWVGVKKGDKVNPWQVVATLDRAQLKKNMQKALSFYMTERWDFEQTRDDNNVNTDDLDSYVLTEEQRRILEKAQFALDRSVFDVELQDILLRESVLISPIAGTVVDESNLIAGINLTSADLQSRTINIVDLDTVYFEAEVDELDYDRLKIDQEVLILLDAFPGKEFQGRVSFIGRQGVVTAGGVTNILTEVDFLERSADIISNLNGEAEFLVDQKIQALAVPSEYVFRKEETDYVLLYNENTTIEKQVQIGLRTDDSAEVIDGLAPGDVIALPAK